MPVFWGIMVTLQYTGRFPVFAARNKTQHSGFVMFAMADWVAAPVLHTVHGPFDAGTTAFYGRHAHRAWVAGLSREALRALPGKVQDFKTVISLPFDALPLRRSPGSK